ncbi:unnamed protein product [Adineta ricciae]|uniref:Fucosyltransferase n=1 Tax=Adineta ricciae TaxID=249248 RepID=A0A814CWS6_ADIRI|nr:unnamed protein product [Adineta ricciae]
MKILSEEQTPKHKTSLQQKNMFSHRSLALYGGHEDEVNCLVFSCDFEILLTGSIGGYIRIWNTVHHRLTLKIQQRAGRIRAITISNDDKYFATSANDTDVRLYETRTGRLVHLLKGHQYPSDCVQFSSNDRLVASGSWDCRTILWSVTTGEQMYNFDNHTNAVQSIAFHSYRNIMITGSHDHNIFLYDFDKLSSSTPVKLQGHSNNVQGLAFSSLPYFASAGWDKSIIIWHLETCRIHSRLYGHTGWIHAVVFRDNPGSILASIDDDTVRVWNILTSICSYRLKILSDVSCFVRFLPNNRGIVIGSAIYEVLFDQQVSSHTRSKTKHVCEPSTVITKLTTSPTNNALKIKLTIDYRDAQKFYLTQQLTCQKRLNQTEQKPKIILFWTKIFTTPIDERYVNNYLFTSSGRCSTDRCLVTSNRQQLCASDAVIFHARGPIHMHDMPKVRSAHQRYVLLTKEPPYKTTAIVGHLNSFFNWTATYRVDSDISYRYFQWRQKSEPDKNVNKQSYLNNRQARAALMISNCYSQSNREEYLERLETIVPVTRMGYCSSNKCPRSRDSCLKELAVAHPFYLAFENSLCRDYVTEKYANVITTSQMIPVIFSHAPNLYIPGSYINANQFSSPEELGRFLIYLVSNATAYDSYFAWKREYELVIPDENDYLCELCRKLNNSTEPYKIYSSMKQWLYTDATCQRWVSKLNRTIDVSVDETMDYEEPWF